MLLTYLKRTTALLDRLCDDGVIGVFAAFLWVLNAITHTMASSLSVVSGPIR